MNFPNYFADAESDFNNAQFVIFGVPYDKTSSFRLGASQGPKKLGNLAGILRHITYEPVLTSGILIFMIMEI